ncbi:hypothetical protein [Haloferax sp. YSSS75]|uniref:hypothetical protein n=1 Tax=Haloferax sp. YSSS75 TaxID=3388564 RepID=UPI00398CF3D8
MAKQLNPRVESEIRKAIDDIAAGEWTISDTAAKLIRIGIAVRESGAEPKIEGPFGLPRPFAKISLGDTMVELRTEVSEDTADRLTNEFDNKPNTAAREALRLGVIAVSMDELKIRGPAGEPRPFAQIELDEIGDHDVRKLIQELSDRL